MSCTFLADENFPGKAILALRSSGRDVAWIRQDSPGLPDREILARAMRESRVILTFDKDFGELAWRARLPASCGVVLFRLPPPMPARLGPMIVELLGESSDWIGQFSVIEPGRVRVRRLLQ